MTATKFAATVWRMIRSFLGAGNRSSSLRDAPPGVAAVHRRKDQVPRLGGAQAASQVSRSRISPTRTTSGSSRISASGPVERWAVRADLALVDDAVWSSKRNSIGSSIVTMWQSRRSG